MPHPHDQKTFFVTGVCCLFLIIGIPRLFSLDAHWSSDETRWLTRSAQFMDAVKHAEFSKTLVTHHPGVTTMWLAGLRTFWTEPRLNVENLARARWFIGIVVWIGIGIACLLLYKLFGQWIALAGFACLAYSPLFLVQTRRVHTDALATLFILLTVLLFLLYCQNRHRCRYLILSGAAFGLALISKSYALIVLPWVPICLFLFREKPRVRFETHIAAGLCFLNCAVLTSFICWPVFWSPILGLLSLCLFGLTILLLSGMKKERYPIGLLIAVFAGLLLMSGHAIQRVWIVFDKVNWAVATPHEVEHFFLGKVVNDPGWLFYPFVLSIKSTPLMLPLVLVGCLLLWKHRNHSEEMARYFKTGLVLGIGIVLFTLCLSATSKKFPRYLLPAFPMLEILAAVGFVEGIKWSYIALHARFRTTIRTHKKLLVGLACVVLIFMEVFPVIAHHPYYGVYYNPCWKLTDITKVITVGSDASGVELAAKYLNEKEKATQMTIQASPIASEFLRYYFVGKTRGIRIKQTTTARSPIPMAYEVVYIRDSQIGWFPQSGTLNGKLESVITLNGIDHVWLYRIPPPQEEPD